jgi:tripartite-type tricarboxylate transporter receptor subunit TctC
MCLTGARRPAVNDLIGGHIDMVAVDVSALLPHIRSGAIKALAVTSATRSDALPGVPQLRRTYAGLRSWLLDRHRRSRDVLHSRPPSVSTV